MALQRFLIAPMSSGLQKNLRPWMIMDDAWFTLANMYLWRGRLRKRWGTVFSSESAGIPNHLATRVKVLIGTTDGAGDLVFTTLPGTVLNRGAVFSVGNQIFTVTTVPVVVGNANTLSTLGTATGTVRLNSVLPNVYQFSITGVNPSIALADVYFYPALPIMGIHLFQSNAINDDPTFVWDTQFAYQFSGDGWTRLGTAVWTGNDADFFWATNYRGSSAGNAYLFVTNDVIADGIKYWDGAVWNNMTVTVGVGRVMQTALIVIPFHNRLVFLNTQEDGVNFATRARFSAIGNPIENAGTSYFPWYDNPNAPNWIGGGFEDNIQTQQQIVSAQFIKDRLIVFFESSTWELVYTGNQILPFRWQQINVELGSESSFSTVPFDKQVLTFGNVGLHNCTGASVERIDQLIPDTVFGVSNLNSGPQRVNGIRDYFFENVYWSFASGNSAPESDIFPNQVLVYNYANTTWALIDDSFTFFGYFQQQSSMTWALDTNLWAEEDATWSYPNLDAKNIMILAGNQEGYVLKIRQDVSRNAAALQITNITVAGIDLTLTIINHNLEVLDIATGLQAYVLIENIPVGDPFAGLNGGIYPIKTLVDSNNIVITAFAIAGVYTGGGTVARVSNVNLLSKAWNPFAKDGSNLYIERIEFNVDRTEDGELIVDYYPAFTDVSMITPGNAILGNNKLETFPYFLCPPEASASQLWHPVYFSTQGETVQINIYMNAAQMQDPDISLSDIQIHALLLYLTPTGRLQ